MGTVATMDTKTVVFLATCMLAIGMVTATEVKRRQKRSFGSHLFGDEGVNEAAVDGADADQLKDISERDMQELENRFREVMLERRSEDKRGIFDCAGWNRQCHAFKHCCGRLKCDRRNIFSKGRCKFPR